MIVAASIAVLAATASAHAEAPLSVSDSSVRSGWTNLTKEVAVRYNLNLSVAGSTASLTSNTGAAVAGTPSVQGAVVRFTSALSLASSGSPYTLVVRAISATATPGTPATISVLPFTVDPLAPKLAVVQTPEHNSRVDGAQAVDIHGTATDRLGDNDTTTYTSGVARVEVRFFNPAKAFSLTGGSKEVTSLRSMIDICTGSACPTEGAWSLSKDLDPGYWTIQVIVYDAAGNTAAPTPNRSFLVL